MNVVIPVGGGAPVSVAPKDVNFYDYDGTLLFAYTIAEAQALAALPTQPTHTGLTGQGWNYTLADVKALTYPASIGALYITDDGKTRLYVRVSNNKNVVVSFNQSVSYGVVIDWGDGGATETISGTDNQSKAHTYSVAGEYVITLNPTGTTSLQLGTGDGYSSVINTTNNTALERVEIGKNVTAINRAFYGAIRLTTVSVTSSVMVLKLSFARSAYMLRFFVVPRIATILPEEAFCYCTSLTGISTPATVTSMGISMFKGTNLLQSLVLPVVPNYVCQQLINHFGCMTTVVVKSGATSIGSSAFEYCYGVRDYYFLRATPPTLSSASDIYVHADCKIHVPAASLAAYQAATSWSTHAAKMVGDL